MSSLSTWTPVLRLLPTSDSQPRVRRHPTLYYAHGDLVLSADKDNTRVMFCVHKSTLANYSPVFADMLGLPTQRDVNETYEGLPVVHLHDDCEDLEGFLLALYNLGLPLKRLDPNTPVMVHGVLRLATKYQVDRLRFRIVEWLEEDWPTTPLAYIRLCLDEKVYNDNYMRYQALGLGEYAEDKFPEPASAIRLAREFDIPSILPAAYLKLLYADPTLDWRAIREKDGTSHGRLVRSARWHLLDQTDMLRLAQGRSRLVSCLPHVHRAFMLSPRVCRDNVSTDDELSCHQIIEKQHNEFTAARYSSFWTGVQEAEKPDPIQVLHKLHDEAADWKLCASCTELFRGKIATEIKKIWDDLPRIFSLVPEA